MFAQVVVKIEKPFGLQFEKHRVDKLHDINLINLSRIPGIVSCMSCLESIKLAILLN